MLTLVEHIKPHGVDGARRPQSQRIHVPATPPHDGGVIGHGFYGLFRVPDRASTARSDGSLNSAAEVDIVDHFGPFEFPRIAERQPFLRILLLPSIADDLAEQAMVVSNSVPVGRYPYGCHTLHEAGSEAPEAAVTKCGIRLRRAQLYEIN